VFPPRGVARQHWQRRGKKALVEHAPLGRQAIAHEVAEAAPAILQELQALPRRRLVEQFADRDTQPLVVPPGRVEAGEHGDDGTAQGLGRGQRPFRGDHVGVGEVLQQEMPVLALFGVVAVGHQPGRSRGRHVSVKRHLAAARYQRPAGARHWQLEDQRRRRAVGGAFVGEPEAHDARQHHVACRIGHDFAHATIGQDAVAAQDGGEMRSVGEAGRNGHGAHRG